MNKELDRADLELQLISWSKKRTAKYEELTNESYGQNPIRDLKLQNEIEEIVSEIVVRFNMENPNKKYHIPIIISPNGYSIWWSE